MWSEKFWIIFHHLGANSWYPRMSIGLTPLLQLHHLCGIFLDHPFQGISNVLLTSGVVVKFLCLQAFKSLFKQLHHCQKKVKGGRCLTTNYIVSPGLVKKLHETLTLILFETCTRKSIEALSSKDTVTTRHPQLRRRRRLNAAEPLRPHSTYLGNWWLKQGPLLIGSPKEKKDLWEIWHLKKMNLDHTCLDSWIFTSAVDPKDVRIPYETKKF